MARAATAVIRGQRPHALRILGRLALGWSAYFAVVLGVALVATQTVRGVGEPQCFDEWCVTVLAAARTTTETATKTATATGWTVTLRLSSRAQHAVQRERGAVVYLTDAQHRRFDPDPDPSAVPLDAMLLPQASVNVARTFAVPSDAQDVGLVITHEGGFPTRWFIIGENPWFHRPPIVRLDREPR